MKNKVVATKEIRIKVSPDEKAAWQTAATRDGRNLADWLRFVAHQAAGSKGSKVGIIQMPDITIEGIMSETDQRNRDLRTLREVCDASDDSPGDEEYDGFEVPDAFFDMLGRLEDGKQTTLSPKQRDWVNRVAASVGIEESVGPSDDGGPEPTRLTSGPVPRGREVELLVKDRPLRPPQRRA